VSQANVSALVEDVKQTRANGDREIARLKGDVTKFEEAEKKAKADTAAKVAALTVEIAKSKEVNASVDAATRELIQRRDEVKLKDAAIASLQEKMNAIEVKNKEILDKFIRTDIAARSLQDRLKRMMDQNDTLAKEVERMRTGASITAETKPPEDVKGVVLDADPKSSMVTLSIGSDAGLAKGMTLEVYTLSPEPRYKGKVKVLEVNAHQAVARPVSMSRTATIQKGDTVASNIMERP
jgi:vacuolar-type H+-ATPase subunit I/STV1